MQWRTLCFFSRDGVVADGRALRCFRLIPGAERRIFVVGVALLPREPMRRACRRNRVEQVKPGRKGAPKVFLQYDGSCCSVQPFAGSLPTAPQWPLDGIRMDGRVHS